MTEDAKQKIKIDDLKKRYREVEGENELLQGKLYKAQKSIKRLRLERTLLLERIENNVIGVTNSDSDTGSELLHNDLLLDKHHHSTKHHKHLHNDPNTHTAVKPPKKKKDPNAPKGPGNVFFLFCRLQRDKIKDENPDENIGDVTKLLGVKWKGMTEEEKKVYYDTFKREMEEHEEAMKFYKSNGGGLNNESIDQVDSTVTDLLVASPSIMSTDDVNTSTAHHTNMDICSITSNSFDSTMDDNHTSPKNVNTTLKDFHGYKASSLWEDRLASTTSH